MENLIFCYTIEEAIADGEMVEVTEKVKGIIKWRTVLSNHLNEEIKRINKDDQDAMDCIIKDIASMFAIAVKRNPGEGTLVEFECSLDVNLKRKPQILWAVINISESDKPILTLIFPSDY